MHDRRLTEWELAALDVMEAERLSLLSTSDEEPAVNAYPMTRELFHATFGG